MIRFLVDAQLPPALCDWFEAKGYTAQHVAEMLGGRTPDRVIAACAASGGWTLVTKDDDFRFRFPPVEYRLIWLCCGNITNVGLRVWLDKRWPMIAVRLDAGETLIEVR